MLKPSLVLCLGNELLADDALGFRVAELLLRSRQVTDQSDVVFAARAGFALLDLLTDRSRVLVVDSICLGGEVGTVHFFPMKTNVPSRNLTCSHQLSLPAALALGCELGYALPDQIDILAVEAKDVTTLGGDLTPAVKASIPNVLALVADWARARPMSATKSPWEVTEYA